MNFYQHLFCTWLLNLSFSINLQTAEQRTWPAGQSQIDTELAQFAIRAEEARKNNQLTTMNALHLQIKQLLEAGANPENFRKNLTPEEQEHLLPGIEKQKYNLRNTIMQTTTWSDYFIQVLAQNIANGTFNNFSDNQLEKILYHLLNIETEREPSTGGDEKLDTKFILNVYAENGILDQILNLPKVKNLPNLEVILTRQYNKSLQPLSNFLRSFLLWKHQRNPSSSYSEMIYKFFDITLQGNSLNPWIQDYILLCLEDPRFNINERFGGHGNILSYIIHHLYFKLKSSYRWFVMNRLPFYIQLIETLIKHGANPNQETMLEHTLAQIATEFNLPHIIERIDKIQIEKLLQLLIDPTGLTKNNDISPYINNFQEIIKLKKRQAYKYQPVQQNQSGALMAVINDTYDKLEALFERQGLPTS